MSFSAPFFRAVALVALLLAPPALAQQGMGALPDWQHTSINDFAGLLSPADTQALDQALIALHAETGVEGTVVTLPDRARHGGADGLEPFATRLFNHWGIGDAQRNDGFMVLVLPDNREARIELGRRYPASANTLAGQIMADDMLPAFRDGDYSRGIRAGTLAVIDGIARPVAAGQPVSAPGGGKSGGKSSGALPGAAIFGAGAAAMFGLAGWRRRRRNRCPRCGHQGLTAEDAPIREADADGGWRTAMADRLRRCPSCGWQETARIPLPVITHYDRFGQRERVEQVRSSSGSSGFGGGSSSGGGASGRW